MSTPATQIRMLPGERDISVWLESLPTSHPIHKRASDVRNSLESNDKYGRGDAERGHVPLLVIAAQRAVSLNASQCLAQGIPEAPAILRKALFLQGIKRHEQADALEVFENYSLARFLLTVCRKRSILSFTLLDDEHHLSYFSSDG